MNLLEVQNLTVEFSTDQGKVSAVRDVSFHLEQGETLGIVGESGSGKSVTMYSIMGLLASNGKIAKGSVNFNGKEISASAFHDQKEYEKTMRAIRGREMAMIFQDPMSFLNPVLNIETQLVEPLVNHFPNMSHAERRQRAIDLLAQVGVPSPERRLKQFPHEFSGGMRQRIIIAIALACDPKLIIADEPTTALDVTIQAKILKLIQFLKTKTGASVILITHDLGVVANNCSRIAVMYGGKIVETATADEIFYDPKHPYTIGLLRSVNNPEKDQPLIPIPGSPPDLLNPPKGCPFVDRCEHAMRICKDHMPDEKSFSYTHTAACWLNWKDDFIS